MYFKWQIHITIGVYEIVSNASFQEPACLNSSIQNGLIPFLKRGKSESAEILERVQGQPI